MNFSSSFFFCIFFPWHLAVNLIYLHCWTCLRHLLHKTWIALVKALLFVWHASTSSNSTLVSVSALSGNLKFYNCLIVLYCIWSQRLQQHIPITDDPDEGMWEQTNRVFLKKTRLSQNLWPKQELLLPFLEIERAPFFYCLLVQNRKLMVSLVHWTLNRSEAGLYFLQLFCVGFQWICVC